MSDVTPQTKQQALLTTILSWLVLAYIAGLGCACICANAGQSASSSFDKDITLSVDLTAAHSSQDVDARLLPALATIERIKTLAMTERFEARGQFVEHDEDNAPVPQLQLAPKNSPPA